MTTVPGTRFGLLFPEDYSVSQVEWCRPGLVTWTPAGNVLGVEYQDPIVGRDTVTPLGCVRVTAPTSGSIYIVEHPTEGVVDVTTAREETIAVIAEHRGVFGVGAPGHLPCSTPAPVVGSSWSALKVWYR